MNEGQSSCSVILETCSVPYTSFASSMGGGDELEPASVGCMMAVLVTAFLMHTLGIYCCCKEKKELQNQKIILVNLSAVQILTITFMMVHLCTHYTEFAMERTVTGSNLLCTMYHIVTCLSYNSMMLVPVDRVICILSPTAYYVHVRKSTLKNGVCGIWICSIIWSVIFAAAPISTHTHAKIIQYCVYVSQALFLLISIVGYSLVMFTHFRKSAQQSENRLDRKRVKRTFYISLALIGTFTVLNMVPNYIQTTNRPFTIFKVIVTYIGLAVDPVLYIFLDRALRPIAVDIITCGACFTQSEAEAARKIIVLQQRRKSLADPYSPESQVATVVKKRESLLPGNDVSVGANELSRDHQTFLKMGDAVAAVGNGGKSFLGNTFSEKTFLVKSVSGKSLLGSRSSNDVPLYQETVV